jgi:hypothetical protein
VDTGKEYVLLSVGLIDPSEVLRVFLLKPSTTFNDFQLKEHGRIGLNPRSDAKYLCRP